MKNKDLKIILSIFAVVLLFFGIDLFIEYSNDTYAVLEDGLMSTAKDMALRNARPVIALFYILWSFTPLQDVQFYYFSFFLAILSLTAGLFVIQKDLEEYLPEDAPRVMLTFFSIVNVFFINFFSFFEKGPFMLAIFTAALASHFEREYMRSGKRKYAFLSLALLVFTALDYQVMTSVFFMLSLIFAIRYSESLKTFCKRFISIALKMALSVVPVACILIFGSSERISGGNKDYAGDILRTLRNLIRHSLQTHDIIPKYFWLIPALICLISCIVIANKSKNRGRSYLSLLITGFSCIALGFFFVFTAYSGYSTPRTIYPLGMTPGMLLINASVNCDVPDEGRYLPAIKKCVYAVVFLHLLLLCIVFNKKFINRYAVNRLDKYMILNVDRLIKEYEKESGNKITKISFYDDSVNCDHYGDILDIGVNVSSSMSTEWSRLTSINWYCNTDYTEAEPSEKYREYFHQYDWSTFSEDQLVFDEDTLHFCLY